MNIKKNLDHIIIGLLFSVLGTLLGLFLIECYWLFSGYKFGTVWRLLQVSETKSSILTLSQVPNVGIFFFFYRSKRDRSAYGVILFFLLLAIPIAIDKFL